VCVHPNDERYKSMVGKMVKVPMTDRIIPGEKDPIRPCHPHAPSTLIYYTCESLLTSYGM
jgi:hypothetical protein